MDYELRVIDLNAMASKETLCWMCADPKHMAVITDFALMETFRGDTERNLYENFGVFRLFPEQCLKMYPNDRLRKLPTYGQMRDAIDWEYTEELQNVLRLQMNTNFKIPQWYLDANRKIAEDKIGEIGRNVSKNRAVFMAIAGQVRAGIIGRTPDDIPKLSKVGLTKLKNFAVDLARDLCRFEDPKLANSDLDTIANTFYFRYAASSTAIMLIRMMNGSLKTIADSKLRNDVVDGNYLACSTYFHGFMTNDGPTAKAYRVLTEVILT